MVFQLSLRWEDAWTFLEVLICFSSLGSSADYLATKHHLDVSTLADRGMYLIKEHQPVSIPLQDSIRFFQILPPIPPTACLTVSLPKGQWHGATTFRVFDSEYLRFAISAGGNDVRAGRP